MPRSSAVGWCRSHASSTSRASRPARSGCGGMILQLADAQQRRDDAQQLVDIGQRCLGGRGKGVAVAIVAHTPLDPCAQPRQGRAQLVRDIVADPAHVADQQLQPVEHQVDVGAQQPETVGIARHRQPPGQVARHDPLGQAANRIDLPRRAPPGDQPRRPAPSGCPAPVPRAAIGRPAASTPPYRPDRRRSAGAYRQASDRAAPAPRRGACPAIRWGRRWRRTTRRSVRPAAGARHCPRSAVPPHRTTPGTGRGADRGPASRAVPRAAPPPGSGERRCSRRSTDARSRAGDCHAPAPRRPPPAPAIAGPASPPARCPSARSPARADQWGRSKT